MTTVSKKEPDLYRRSVKGGYWVILLRLTTNALSFGKVLVIANFFVLENLGIISIALMMMEILSTFTQTGFDAALVQKKENIHSYLDTAWVAGLVKGIFLFLILYSAAPFLASIRVPQDKVALTISILRVMSFCFLIGGARNIGTIYFQKELQFRKVFTLTLASTLTDIVLSLTFIFIFHSIWGVIAARILASAVDCIGSYILSPYRPQFRFEYAKARELWGFGKWIYSCNIIGYLISQGDNYFVWSYLGLPKLVLYKYAFDLATMPATHISGVISSISFPAYSKIQNDIPRLREAYLKVLKLTALLSSPAAFAIFILGPDFVHLFLPERMSPMILPLQLLAFKGLLISFGTTISPVHQSIGKPKIPWLLSLCFLPMMAALIYPLTKMWGITGTALSTIIPSLLTCPVNTRILCRVLNCRIRDILGAFLLPITVSVIITGLLFVLKMSFFTLPSYISFTILSIISLCLYGFMVWQLDGIAKQGLREIIHGQIEQVKQRLRSS